MIISIQSAQRTKNSTISSINHKFLQQYLILHIINDKKMQKSVVVAKRFPFISFLSDTKKVKLNNIS